MHTNTISIEKKEATILDENMPHSHSVHVCKASATPH